VQQVQQDPLALQQEQPVQQALAQQEQQAQLV
jgi:hypothetical protein